MKELEGDFVIIKQKMETNTKLIGAYKVKVWSEGMDIHSDLYSPQ